MGHYSKRASSRADRTGGGAGALSTAENATTAGVARYTNDDYQRIIERKRGRLARLAPEKLFNELYVDYIKAGAPIDEAKQSAMSESGFDPDAKKRGR